MAKPTEIMQWGTDVGATDDPGVTRRATGFVAGKKAPAKWFNFLHNAAGKWFAYLDNLHAEAEFLNKAYTWTGLQTFANSLKLGAGVNLEYATTQTRTSSLDLHHAVIDVSSPLQFDADGCAVFPAAGAVKTMRVPFKLPDGATLQTVSASVFPGSGSVDMSLTVRARGKSGTGSSAVTLGTPDTRSNAATIQHMTVPGLSEVATAATWYWLEAASDDGSGSGTLTKASITWLDPGPRNF